jgi:hypothetical protein
VVHCKRGLNRQLIPGRDELQESAERRLALTSPQRLHVPLVTSPDLPPFRANGGGDGAAAAMFPPMAGVRRVAMAKPL